MNFNQDEEMVRMFTSQVKLEDVVNVGFMRPMEFALRTHKTDNIVPPNVLPQGMMVAVKENSIEDNKYSLTRLEAVDPSLTLNELRKKQQDNYVSLLKRPQGMELAICVCMYSEDKPMLKRTLRGIADNIHKLIQSGLSPDDIFVCIVIDGILKVDESLFDYFEEFERESQIFLEEDDKLSMKQKYQDFKVETEFEEDQEPLNYSKFIFSPEEYQNRIERKFTNVRDKYESVNRLRTQIQDIKKENKASNQNLKMIINKIIDQQKAAIRTMTEDTAEELEITEQSIMKELGNSEEECNQYIASRDLLAYVLPFRLPTRSLSSSVAEWEERERTSRGSDESNDESRGLRASMLAQGIEPQTPKQKEQSESGRRNRKYVNLFFCIKYKNSGKLSSHNWFFNGFCNQLKPKVAILLDVGLRPFPNSVFKMYNYLKKHKEVGGVCGYMSLKIEKVQDEQMHKDEDLDWLSSLATYIFDIQKAQQIEYHFAHLIDKPFESIFRFIHVLPGAFSGYSMEALRPKDRQDVLLREYFKSIDQKLANNKVVPNSFQISDILMRVFLPKFIWKHIQKVDPDSEQQVLYNQNIYLAEDRILCMGIHKNEKDIIFMPDAYAEVDPIKTVNGLMGQRKRWINGSMFAFEKVQKEMQEFSSPAMAVADCFLKLQIFYLNFSNYLVYFAPALMLFTFHLTMQSFRQAVLLDIFNISDPEAVGSIIFATFISIMDFIYIVMLLSTIFLCVHLTHNNKRFIYFIYLFSTLFGAFGLMTFLIFMIDAIKGFAGADNFLRQEYAKKLNAEMEGAGDLIDLMRYLIVVSMGLYTFPIILYGIFFLRITYFWEILAGTFSFLFYSPTYLNLLNVYALCRIDDISWGTKGLDSSVGGKNAGLKQTWKIVKIIDVCKFTFWNCFFGFIALFIDNYLLIKFFLMLSILILFILVLAVKMVIGLVYLCRYRCIIADTSNKHETTEENNEEKPEAILEKTQPKLHLYSIIDVFQESIRKDIKMSFELAACEENIGAGESIGRISKAIVTRAFGDNELQNMRKNNEIRKSFYPDLNKHRASRMARASRMQETTNLELHLLQRRVEQQTKKNEPGLGREVSQRFSKIRQTFFARLQAKQ